MQYFFALEHYLRIIKFGILYSLLFIFLTVSIDSYFWGKLVWPELQVLYFNTYMNKSSDWGVSPFYWYFLNALPKSLTACIPLIAVALFYQPRNSIVDREVLYILFPAVIFVSLYSILPHKELRFIFPSLTLFTLAGAFGLRKMYQFFSKSLV